MGCQMNYYYNFPALLDFDALTRLSLPEACYSFSTIDASTLCLPSKSSRMSVFYFLEVERSILLASRWSQWVSMPSFWLL
jgi:hypothetical protein